MDGKPVVRPRSYFVGAAALIMAGVIGGLGLSAGLNLQRNSNATSAELAAVTNSAPIPESPFVSVVDRALPAVVFIDVRKKATESADPNDEFMRRFFGEGGGTSRRQQRVPSSGSGFLIDPNGRIITNNHVVANADEITVTLNDRRQFKAKVVGADPETDVAVIQVDGKNLPFLPLGDSDKLRVGDWAIAIGNPLGELRGSVTVGIVSAQGRTNLNIFGGTPEYQDFIQTDASINFGNSGGPLCNIRGEVIGINTAINTSGQGIGFAVPINLARHVAEQLVAHGTVKRSMLGVMLAEMTPEMAEGFGLAGQQGVLIQQVMDNSPAARAGLERNDIIVEYQGQPVSDMQKLRLKVADTPSGTKVNLVVIRDGKRMPFAVTLKDKDDRTAAAQPEAPQDDKAALGGLTVRTLREKIDSGVMVTDVEDGSPADERGLQPGDIIEQVGQTPVKDEETFTRLMNAQKRAGRPAVLFVTRNGNGQYVTFRLDK
ncbi:MAG: Do family serine endopeptidase [Candidatus Eisenbacteria bacterium]|uniref:Do family serine endopeptidase n=1 Tax=Eiseniibacteriota bacterium TaxID=2212470 RepID=A0A933W9F0_UNCEI|nr:Do family serine endopeptidase [Candidatus Eisenbacteria bacterium]